MDVVEEDTAVEETVVTTCLHRQDQVKFLSEIMRLYLFYITDRYVLPEKTLIIVEFIDTGAPVVQTECPSGSKCVAEHFCDANGVMSNSRVSLTQYEKDQRGEMIVRTFPIFITNH